MNATTYRSYMIMTDGYCYYVENTGEEYPFDTLAEARAFIDAIRLERTLNMMAKS